MVRASAGNSPSGASATTPPPAAGTSDLLGHSAILQQLWSAVDRETLHHAYLFEGPSGVGKHTVAVRLAMAANCTGQTQVRPCGACPTCVQIAHGTHPDVITLEPEADRATPIISVAQVREVVRLASYHRYNARRRVVIVNPAEALQDAAANALLKTLEEPPPGTGFILVVTHARSLLPTIISRCQRQRFRAVADEEIEAWLTARGIDDARAIARASMGCPGRALAFAGGDLATRRALRDTFLAVLSDDLGAVFAWSAEICKGGRQDWRGTVEMLIELTEELLRDVVIRGGGGRAPLLHEDITPVLDAWTRSLWPDGVNHCADRVADARDNLHRNVSGRTVVEALLTGLQKELGPARSG